MQKLNILFFIELETMYIFREAQTKEAKSIAV